MSKPKSYLFSTFNENYNHFLLYLFFFFRVQMGNGPRVKGLKESIGFPDAELCAKYIEKKIQ